MATTAATAVPTMITIEATVDAPVELVWNVFTDPKHIVQWNAASDDWHTTASTNDVTVGGTFSSTMAAKDGSRSFDFAGTYTAVELHETIEYTLGDDRVVRIQFTTHGDGAKQTTQIVETFQAEGTHSVEQQRVGWQSILNNFKKHAEAVAAGETP